MCKGGGNQIQEESEEEKSDTEGSTISGRVVYSTISHAQSNDGQTYIPRVMMVRPTLG